MIFGVKYSVFSKLKTHYQFSGSHSYLKFGFSYFDLFSTDSYEAVIFRTPYATISAYHGRSDLNVHAVCTTSIHPKSSVSGLSAVRLALRHQSAQAELLFLGTRINVSLKTATSAYQCATFHSAVP